MKDRHLACSRIGEDIYKHDTKCQYPDEWNIYGKIVGNRTSVWFTGHCTACRSKVVVCQTISGKPADYFWYCGQKGCENHEGQETGDMEVPEWVF